MARTQYHHGDLRETLIEAATAAIRDDGAAALSLRKVAKRAGVSATAPYHHFTDKESLFAEVAKRGFQDMLRSMDKAPDDTPLMRIRGLGVAYLEFGRTEPELYALMFSNAYCKAEEHPELKAAGNATLGLLVAAIVDGRAQGLVYTDDPFTTSLSVWSTVHGLVLLLANKFTEGMDMHGRSLDLQAVVDHTMDLTIQGLTAPPSAP